MIYVIITILSMVGIIVFATLAADAENNLWLGIFAILSGFSIIVFIATRALFLTREDRNPELKHKTLIENRDSAEKELMKFYIDHPEFKEEE